MRRSMQGNRSRDTGPERRLRSELHRLGLRFRKHARPLPRERFTADAVFRSARVAVFVDGCFWHACPEHSRPPRANGEWWARKLAANTERDRRVDAALLAAGWLPLRLWEHEDPARAARTVFEAVRYSAVRNPRRLEEKAMTQETRRTTIAELLVSSGLGGVDEAVARAALDEAEVVDPENALATAEQAERAAAAAEAKTGLRGKCLALWVVTGADGRQQIASARAKRPASSRSWTSLSSAYPDEVREAVRIAIEARGTRAGAPGPKQHVLVRGALSDPCDPSAILRDAGVESESQLRRIAAGEAPREELGPLRALAGRVGDPFCRGRNLASILVAAIAQAPAKTPDPDAARRARKAQRERERRARIRAERAVA